MAWAARPRNDRRVLDSTNQTYETFGAVLSATVLVRWGQDCQVPCLVFWPGSDRKWLLKGSLVPSRVRHYGPDLVMRGVELLKATGGRTVCCVGFSAGLGNVGGKMRRTPGSAPRLGRNQSGTSFFYGAVSRPVVHQGRQGSPGSPALARMRLLPERGSLEQGVWITQGCGLSAGRAAGELRGRVGLTACTDGFPCA